MLNLSQVETLSQYADNMVGHCQCDADDQCCCCVASFLTQYKYCRELDLSPSPGPCCLVIDCGYSFTHLVPYYDGRPVRKAVRRYVRSCTTVNITVVVQQKYFSQFIALI